MVHGYPRANRLSKLILETLADEVKRLKDPRLELLTLTGVEVGADLTLATVFFSTTRSDVSLDECREGLEASAHRLRRSLARQLHIKRIPALRFFPDPAIITGERVDEVLRDLDAGTEPASTATGRSAEPASETTRRSEKTDRGTESASETTRRSKKTDRAADEGNGA